MRKILFIILVLLVFPCSVTTLSQEAIQSLRIKVRPAGRNLMVIEGRQKHLLAVRDKIDAARIEDIKLLYANRNSANIFLVVDVSGWSRSEQNDRQCGAGEERNLLWIKLSSMWRLDDVQSVKYESCWTSVEPDDNYEIKGQHLQFKYKDFSKSLGYDLSYDASHPEQGFMIEESKLKVE